MHGNQSLELFHRYKTCAVSVSNTGKQQFTAKQSICIGFRIKTVVFRMILMRDVVFGLCF